MSELDYWKERKEMSSESLFQMIENTKRKRKSKRNVRIGTSQKKKESQHKH